MRHNNPLFIDSISMWLSCLSTQNRLLKIADDDPSNRIKETLTMFPTEIVTIIIQYSICVKIPVPKPLTRFGLAEEPSYVYTDQDIHLYNLYLSCGSCD